MPRKSPISIFLAATSILTIATTEDVSLKAGENDIGGLIHCAGLAKFAGSALKFETHQPERS